MNLVWAMIITLWSYQTGLKDMLYETYPPTAVGHAACLKKARAALFFDSDPASNQTNRCALVYVERLVPAE
jgi:hypothetical protein